MHPVGDTCELIRLETIMTTPLNSTKHSQTVRPTDNLRFPERTQHVEIRAHGVERINAPAGHTWDSFFINGPQVSADFMVERASQD
jgi:antitoxin VapB